MKFCSSCGEALAEGKPFCGSCGAAVTGAEVDTPEAAGQPDAPATPAATPPATTPPAVVTPPPAATPPTAATPPVAATPPAGAPAPLQVAPPGGLQMPAPLAGAKGKGKKGLIIGAAALAVVALAGFKVASGGPQPGSNTDGGQTTGTTDGGQTTGTTDGGQTTGATDGGQTTGATDGGQTTGATDGGQTTGATDGGQTDGGGGGNNADADAALRQLIQEQVGPFTLAGAADGTSLIELGALAGYFLEYTSSTGNVIHGLAVFRDQGVAKSEVISYAQASLDSDGDWDLVDQTPLVSEDGTEYGVFVALQGPAETRLVWSNGPFWAVAQGSSDLIVTFYTNLPY